MVINDKIMMINNSYNFESQIIAIIDQIMAIYTNL